MKEKKVKKKKKKKKKKGKKKKKKSLQRSLIHKHKILDIHELFFGQKAIE